MVFTKGDRSEVESLLGKLTTTMDGLGRSRRDIELVLKMNPYWPSSVRSTLLASSSALLNMLAAYAALETSVVDAINAELPPPRSE